MSNNIALMGIPRSGTTLACSILNRWPNVVALHEPIQVNEILQLKERKLMCAEIVARIINLRKLILASKRAVSLQIHGIIPDNSFDDNCNTVGLRPNLAHLGEIVITKPLAHDFLLVIKHVSLFSGLIKQLKDNFPCYAIIRNPLAVLGSWNSVDTYHHMGHSPAVEAIDENTMKKLNQTKDHILRQLILLSWYFEQYSKHLSADAILRYEEIIDSGGRVLGKLVSAPNAIDRNLENKNSNRLYDMDLMYRIGDALLKFDGYYLLFYSKDDIEMLLKNTIRIGNNKKIES